MNALPCGCPRESPKWDGKEIDLSGHWAHILPMPSLLHMPLGYDIYRQRQQQEIEQLELQEQYPGLALLQTGFLRGRLIRLLKEDTVSPSRRVQNLPLGFQLYGKLHRGGVGTLRSSVLAMQGELLDSGRMPKELYLCYLTCPQCAERRGGDKIMLLRRWQQSARLQKRRRR